MSFKRRDLLLGMGSLGLGVGASQLPAMKLLKALLDGFIHRAQAQLEDQNPRQYFGFFMRGGPSRWGFDHLLTPYGGVNNEPFISNAGLGTRFLNPASGTIEYQTYLLNRNISGFTDNLYLPWLWQFQVPSAAGGGRPLWSLLTNALMIRGINSGTDGHHNNINIRFRPTLISPSIDGMIGDGSSAPIGVIHAGLELGNFFNSAKGLGKYDIFWNDQDPLNDSPISKLVGPFQPNDAMSSLASANATLESDVSNLFKTLKSEAKLRGTEAMYIDLKRTQDLFMTSFGDIDTFFQQTYSKYKLLADIAIQDQYHAQSLYPNGLPGITDQPITIRNDRITGFQNEIEQNYLLVGNSDFRTILSTATSWQLAESFALAEFIARNQLSGASIFEINHLSNLNLETYRLFGTTTDTPGSNLNPFQRTLFRDQHQCGTVVELVLNSVYYRGLGACLLEFIDQLKGITLGSGKNLFEESVVDLVSEFNRNPRMEMYGSDHGWQGLGTTMFSGAIKNPVIIGNIYSTPPNFEQDRFKSTYQGSWGYAAPIAQLNNRPATIGHLTSTMAEIIRVRRPLENDIPMISENNGQVIPIVEKAKIIDNT